MAVTEENVEAVAVVATKGDIEGVVEAFVT